MIAPSKAGEGLGGNGPDLEQVSEVILGPDFAAGQVMQCVILGGHWQSLVPVGDEATLMGGLVSPGFDERDFRM